MTTPPPRRRRSGADRKSTPSPVWDQRSSPFVLPSGTKPSSRPGSGDAKLRDDAERDLTEREKAESELERQRTERRREMEAADPFARQLREHANHRTRTDGPDERQIWEAKRRERLKIDDHTCQVCGTRATGGRTLDVHHLTYENFGHEDVESDLVSLCRRCHDLVPEIRRVKRGDGGFTALARLMNARGVPVQGEGKPWDKMTSFWLLGHL